MPVCVTRQLVANDTEIGHLRLDGVDVIGHSIIGTPDSSDGVIRGGDITQSSKQRTGSIQGIRHDRYMRLEAAHFGRVDVDPDHVRRCRRRLDHLLHARPAHILQLEPAADAD